ncbi:MAG: lamin tail domain-containing protein [Bacteroidota bacterium]
MRQQLIALLLLTASVVTAQFTDDFSDGEISRSPRWSGDTTIFRVASGQLQLAAPPVTGQAVIATPSSAIVKATWEWWFAFDFNPSASNLMKVYLISDKPDLLGSLNGYFVMAGNTTDEVSLYRQTGTTVVKLIDGLDGRLNFTTVRGKIKVTTDEDDNWSLSVDAGPTGATGVYQLEGTVQESVHRQGGWFGIRCQFTSTRSDKFKFDDFNVIGQPYPDRIRPWIDSVSVSDSHTVHIRFSEPMDLTASRPEPYRFVQSESLTTSAELSSDGQLVQLRVDPPLVNGAENKLLISGVKDLAGNLLRDTTVMVMHLIPYTAAYRDVIITEIMADPSPPEGLPETEFVEVFNRSDHAISLNGWTITDGSTNGMIPPSVILPGQYKLLLSSAISAGIYPQAIRIASMPSLHNAGDRLRLTSPGETLIDSVSYRIGWHSASGKAEGGWSLELIDPEVFCGPEGNWTSSDDPSGGTPGKKNSVFANRPDLTPPAITSLEVTGPSELKVNFDGKLNMESVSPPAITLLPSGGPVAVLKISDHALRLTASNPFSEGLFYRLQFTGIRDCPGNIAPLLTARFILPSLPDSLDVVVNEILFNPQPGGVDYVEVFNRSNKFLSTSAWTLANSDQGIQVNRKIIPTRLLWPKGFMVFTADREALRLFFPSVPDSVVVEMPMPSLPDEAGSIVVSSSGKGLDAVQYDRAQHGWLLRDEEGIPLERLDPDGPSDDHNNWKSAARGKGTPGAPNSCLLPTASEVDDLTVEPAAFGPDGFTLIRYQFDEPGFMATVRVFDQSGHQIKVLVNNENLGTSGFFRWDGDRDDGGPAGPGFYIVFAELFDDLGHVKRFRRRVIVAAG